jgi:hypothetical protein
MNAENGLDPNETEFQPMMDAEVNASAIIRDTADEALTLKEEKLIMRK